MALSTGGTPPALDDATQADACDAPANLAGADGPITVARCWRPKGHDGAHDGPIERATWGG